MCNNKMAVAMGTIRTYDDKRSIGGVNGIRAFQGPNVDGRLGNFKTTNKEIEANRYVVSMEDALEYHGRQINKTAQCCEKLSQKKITHKQNS